MPSTSGRRCKPLQARVRTAARDVNSLTDHATFLSGKIIFLLDATLGMINIQQNDIIKIFSVAAVVFLPPTLIASIYGMNFHHMPELEWWYAYPLALRLMVLAAVLALSLLQTQRLAVIWACLAGVRWQTEWKRSFRLGDGDTVKENLMTYRSLYSDSRQRALRCLAACRHRAWRRPVR